MANDYHKNLLHEARLDKEKQRIQKVVDKALQSGSNINSADIFIDHKHPYFNPKISHSERKKLFDDVMKVSKVPRGIDINHNHSKDVNFKLEIPESSRIEGVAKESYAPAGSIPYLHHNTKVNAEMMLGTVNKKPTKDFSKKEVKKVDPNTKLPSILFNKTSDKDKKFDSCVDQVSRKQGKSAAYAICRHALKKQQSILKDDKPHPPKSPEAMAHDVAEKDKPFMNAVDKLKTNKEKLKQFLNHLKTLVDKDKHRSPENVLKSSYNKKNK